MVKRERGRYDTSRTVDDIKRQQRGNYDSFVRPDIPQLRIKEGENCLRIMPRTWDDTDRWDIYWSITVWLHYGVGPDEGTYLCLDKMKGERCPVCEARHDADAEEADNLKPMATPVCWAVDRDAERAGPQLWRMPKKQMFDEINTRSIDKKTNTPIIIDDPDKGYDIVFTRTGKDKRTKYTGVEVLREPSPLHDNPKIADRWLEYIEDNPLPEVLQYFSAEYIEKVLYGTAGEGGRRGRDDRGSRRERYRGADDDGGGRRERYRGADDAEAASDDDRRSSRRASSDDDQDAPRSSRFGRRSADEAETPRSSRRASDDDVDDQPRSRRGASDDDRPRYAEDDRRSGRRDREDDGGAEGGRIGRSNGRGGRDEESEFREEPAETPRRGRGGREAEEEDAGPSRRARGQLETMRSRR